MFFLKPLILSFVLFWSPLNMAANEKNLWMSPSNDLNQYHLSVSNQGRILTQTTTPTPYRLIKQIAPTEQDPNHIRYQITYDAIPIWGREIIVHKRPHQIRLTGTLVTGIENDIPKSQPLLKASVAIAAILAKVSTPIKAQKTDHVIYIDENSKAHHAYLLRFFTSDNRDLIQYPHYMIDALDGHILMQWDEAKSSQGEGEGLGGNQITLPYRSGAFQYGQYVRDLPSLGHFPIDRWVLWCYLQTSEIRLFDLARFYIPSWEINQIFPLGIADEKLNDLSSPYSFCMPWSNYYNQNDDGHAPINGAYSPNNDAMYFVDQTLALYHRHGIVNPLGRELPIRIFTHVGNLNNAFYIPSLYKKDGSLYSYQQIVLGDGSNQYSAFSQSIITHELSHGFTNLHSKLIYKDQSGGINESFSDMATIALKDELRTRYPFYWDGEDWSLGLEIARDGQALRYIDTPAKDNKSIQHAKDYKAGIDVHYASGVFNRAFYLLATQPGWNIQTAFDVMIQANKNYWLANSTFDMAACGVIQAAEDKALDSSAVKYAFSEVGVACHAT